MLSYLTFGHIGPLDTGTNNVYIINLFLYARVQFSSVLVQLFCELFQVVRKLVFSHRGVKSLDPADNCTEPGRRQPGSLPVVTGKHYQLFSRN